MQRQRDKAIIIVRDFNTHFATIDSTSRQKISKDVENLKNAVNQLDPTDIYRRTQHPLTAKYTFFSRARGAFTEMDRIPGNETTFNMVISIQITHSMFSHNDGIKLAIKNQPLD